MSVAQPAEALKQGWLALPNLWIESRELMTKVLSRKASSGRGPNERSAAVEAKTPTVAPHVQLGVYRGRRTLAKAEACIVHHADDYSWGVAQATWSGVGEYTSLIYVPEAENYNELCILLTKGLLGDDLLALLRRGSHGTLSVVIADSECAGSLVPWLRSSLLSLSVDEATWMTSRLPGQSVGTFSTFKLEKEFRGVPHEAILLEKLSLVLLSQSWHTSEELELLRVEGYPALPAVVPSRAVERKLRGW